VCWCRPIIPVLRRLRQEDLKFEAILDYIMRHCVKKKKIEPGVVVHICNSRYMRGIGRRIVV
jgi:hypothetical protein